MSDNLGRAIRLYRQEEKPSDFPMVAQHANRLALDATVKELNDERTQRETNGHED